MFPYVQRLRDLVLRPRETWPVLAGEDVSASRLFTGWVLPLAAIPAVAYVLRMELFRSLFASRADAFAAAGLGLTPLAVLAHGVALYVLGVGTVALLAWIVEILVPHFGGRGDYTAGLKIVAYSAAPYWVASILTVFALSALGILVGLVVLAASVYGLYLFYQGLGDVLHVPPEKRAILTVVVVLLALVVGVVIGHLVPTP